ncbi:MAG TPA: S8 family peptidase [Rhizomicrobium sp.]
MLRKSLLVGAALACVLAANGALAADKRLSPESVPSSGAIIPFYGSINPFYGSINPFYGSINPFYGKISPFWGDIQPFWGKVNPFYGDIDPFYGDINPFWGKINPFYGTIKPFWGSVGPYWENAGPQWGAINDTWAQLQASNATNYSGLQSQIRSFLGKADAFWSPAVAKYTGKSFSDGFANDLLAKYGIDPNDPASLADTDAATRSFFFLNWYDGLMNFTGVDHVDWWMPAVNWSPALTQIQGGEGRAIVGILDSTVDAKNSDVDNLKFVGGYKAHVNDHGAAVASLIAAQHDGQGVMGIDPNAEVHLYNPFDATGTASWNDVATGIARLYDSGAHVVNASLGVPGTTVSNEWVNILSGPLLNSRKAGLVIVKAAGNEGVRQTQNVPWLLGLEAPNNLIVVGSVGPSGAISPFSNTPGEACFTLLGFCFEQNKLKYRFVVAPGELILVSDNAGGVTRMSGTSFAAPLVTGAVALLQDRWPWLQSHAEETADIIFRSAKDLGAPGVDPVYGWGELDIQASQSPLDFNKLTVYQPYTYNGKQSSTPLFANWSPSALKSAVLNPGQLNLWQQRSAYVVAFESIGSTYRDFTIPLSSLLANKDQRVNGNQNPFQTYLYQRLIDWAHGVNTLNFGAQTMPLGDGAWRLNMVATPSSPDETRGGAGPFHAEFVASNSASGIDLRIGEGSGAHALAGMAGFSLRTDFDPATGGVNPVLGFASGGAYASGGYAITRDLRVSLGFSQKTDDHLYFDPTFGPLQAVPLAPAKASASVAGIDYTLAKGVTLNASYTLLDEANGLLGAQGSGSFALANGARTEGTTLGLTTAFAGGWTLSGSATLARTTAPQAVQSSLSLSRDGLQSTAFAFVAAKSGLFSEFDTMRLSLTQPLHVESGALNYTSVEVIDRATGALGAVTQAWNVAGKREYRMEAMYGLAVFEGRGEINAFGLVDVNPPGFAETPLSVSVGAQFRVAF